MRFEFASASKIIFGEGTLKEIGPLARELGQRVWVVTNLDQVLCDPLYEILAEHGITVGTFPITGEPTTTMVMEGTRLARAFNPDLVIGFGGGSALDGGKATAAMLTNPGDLMDYLEVIGLGQPLLHLPIPFFAVPTTAGTGAEVTRNAVLAAYDHQVKVSLRSAQMLPSLALVDPELTYDLPSELTAATGMDALTQVMEPFISPMGNPLTDTICRDGMLRVSRSLFRAFQQGDDFSARRDMSLASLFGGLALANAKLGAVHGIAGPLGGMFPAPHGAVCAALLPHVMAVNVRALRQRDPENRALGRYAEVAHLLAGDEKATPEVGVSWVQELGVKLAIPPLSDYGVTVADIPTLVEKGARASSMKGNPIQLTNDELVEIIHRAL